MSKALPTAQQLCDAGALRRRRRLPACSLRHQGRGACRAAVGRQRRQHRDRLGRNATPASAPGCASNWPSAISSKGRPRWRWTRSSRRWPPTRPSPTPTTCAAWSTCGSTMPRSAEDSFRRAIALNPREPNTLHNYGWLLCQQNRYARRAAAVHAPRSPCPSYGDRAKTLMTQGVCQLQAGQRAEAERSLTQAYELDAGNPVIGYNLASLLAQREDWSRAQFYIRRVNNSPSANAETLWLGIKIERQLNNREAASAAGRASCSGASPSRGRRWRTSAGISMIERASEFGASAAVPLMAGDSTAHDGRRHAARGARGAWPAHRHGGGGAQGADAEARGARGRRHRRLARSGVRARAGRQRLPRACASIRRRCWPSCRARSPPAWRRPTAP